MSNAGINAPRQSETSRNGNDIAPEEPDQPQKVAPEQAPVEAAAPSTDEAPQSPDRNLGFYFEGEADLDHIDKLIAETHFGTLPSYEAPFSLQLKTGIRGSFPIDNDVHDIADGAIAKVEQSFILMRSLTFILFILMMVMISSLLYAAGVPGFENQLVIPIVGEAFMGMPGINEMSVIPYLYAAGIFTVFVVFRYSARLLYKREIEINGEKFAYKVKSRYDDIMSKMDKCTRNALLESDHWATRARLWTKIALWCSKRSEYLDRYASTAGWKAKNTMDTSEFIFVALKLIVSLYVLASIAVSIAPVDGGDEQLLTDSYRVGFVLVLAPALVYFWFFFHRFPNDIWTAKFAGIVEEDSAPTGNYFDDISGMVESFVRTISASRFNGGGSRGS